MPKAVEEDCWVWRAWPPGCGSGRQRTRDWAVLGGSRGRSLGPATPATGRRPRADPADAYDRHRTADGPMCFLGAGILESIHLIPASDRPHDDQQALVCPSMPVITHLTSHESLETARQSIAFPRTTHKDETALETRFRWRRRDRRLLWWLSPNDRDWLSFRLSRTLDGDGVTPSRNNRESRENGGFCVSWPSWILKSAGEPSFHDRLHPIRSEESELPSPFPLTGAGDPPV